MAPTARLQHPPRVQTGRKAKENEMEEMARDLQEKFDVDMVYQLLWSKKIHSSSFAPVREITVIRNGQRLESQPDHAFLTGEPVKVEVDGEMVKVSFEFAKFDNSFTEVRDRETHKLIEERQDYRFQQFSVRLTPEECEKLLKKELYQRWR